jgi:hypothetical protein
MPPIGGLTAINVSGPLDIYSVCETLNLVRPFWEQRGFLVGCGVLPSVPVARLNHGMVMSYPPLAAHRPHRWTGPHVSRCAWFLCSSRLAPAVEKIFSAQGRLGLSFGGGRCAQLAGGSPLVHGRSSACARSYTAARRRLGGTICVIFPSPLPLRPDRPLILDSSAWLLRCKSAIPRFAHVLCAVADGRPYPMAALCHGLG